MRNYLRRLLRAIDLLHSLTEADLRFRYGRGPWRVIRWLLEPFALVGVYLLLITFVLDRPGLAPGLSLAAVIVPFQFLISTVGNAMDAVEIRRPILLNMAFERNLLPASCALTECASFVASLSIIVVMMAAYRIAPTVAIFWLPLVVLVNVYLAVAAAYAASLLGLWLRELKPFLLSFVRMLFFLSPGLVPLSQTAQKSETSCASILSPDCSKRTGTSSHRPRAGRMGTVLPNLDRAAILVVFLPMYRIEQTQFAKVV